MFRKTNESGFALLAILVFILLLTSFIAPLSLSSHTRILTTNNVLKKLKAETIAQSAMFMASTRITDEILKLNYETTGQFLRCQFDDSFLNFRIIDHHGLIDLNAASAQLIKLGFQSLGMNELEAEGLSDAVVKFRSRPLASNDNTSHIPENGFKHGPFEFVSELHDFSELRAFSLMDLEELYTVYKKSGLILPELSDVRLQNSILANDSNNPAVNTQVTSNFGIHAISIDLYVNYKNTSWSGKKDHFQLIGSDVRDIRYLGTSLVSKSENYWSDKNVIDQPKVCSALFDQNLSLLFK